MSPVARCVRQDGSVRERDSELGVLLDTMREPLRVHDPHPGLLELNGSPATACSYFRIRSSRHPLQVDGRERIAVAVLVVELGQPIASVIETSTVQPGCRVGPARLPRRWARGGPRRRRCGARTTWPPCRTGPRGDVVEVRGRDQLHHVVVVGDAIDLLEQLGVRLGMPRVHLEQGDRVLFGSQKYSMLKVMPSRPICSMTTPRELGHALRHRGRERGGYW